MQARVLIVIIVLMVPWVAGPIRAETNFSIWPGSPVPVTTDAGPDSAVELGVKFSADASGSVTGIRFYKGSGNTGTHVGHLWSSAGTLLASATFTGETPSGWQQVNFATPVAIAANTVYVASYHTSAGHYSADRYYFAAQGVDNSPLHALADGISGFNGVFSYGASGTFPGRGYRSTNYWVDVVFNVDAPIQANEIVIENRNPGNPASEWDISGSGDASIQGFASDISVDRGSTVYFKVNTNAASYRLDIYRMGYYQGNGARKVVTVYPSAALPQTQPKCLTDSATGLIDCGNWAVSAVWSVPSDATSGIYFAKAVRTDTGGASHIFFIVRNDAGKSDILFQTSDTTWQAYNDWGGKSLYGCGDWNINCRAYKVSYNRPFHTRVFNVDSWVFNGEYPMVRWLEANGYDVTYFSGVDTDRMGELLKNHKVWMSNGHDEYWSGGQRVNVEAALAAGVHLAFFSGNKIFWKTRWENSMDGSNMPFRTLVCYKETHANKVIDPKDPPIWTGTWRDPRFSPPADGGYPGNALGGTIFRINGIYNDAITVPQADGRMRFWRNTGVAALSAGQTATLAPGSLGAEVDVDEDNGFRPAGLFGLSTKVITTDGLYLLNYGSSFGAGTATHRLTLYRHSSGALVFASGSYQWSWGLDANHDRSSFGSTTDIRMQQATVNLFADMGVQPSTLQTGLVSAAYSTDFTPPVSTITSPLADSAVIVGATVMVTGTASDTGGGVVGGVEVSTDGGGTWHPASGRESWTYNWKATVPGTVTILSRAVDDSGNLEYPSAGVRVEVGWGSCSSGCTTIWPGTSVPETVDSGPDSAVELGVKFRADVSGYITGIRFYRGSLNTGAHIGNLWTNNGQLLATAIFTNETASGWQQADFATPVSITANTIYVASYHANEGHYSADTGYFSGKGHDSPPLHAPANGVSGHNGVYRYGTTSGFPDQGCCTANYWVDVVFKQADAGAPVSTVTTPANGAVINSASANPFTVSGTATDNAAVSGIQVSTNGGSTWNTAACGGCPGANVTWQYLWTLPADGSYTIISRATDPSGNAETPGAGNIVTISTTLPTADYTGSPTYGTVPLTVKFNNNSTGYYPPLYYKWDFDSNDTEDSTEMNPSWTYTTSGTYSVWLKVTDSAGNTNSLTRLNYIIGCNLPVKIERAEPVYLSTLQGGYNLAGDAETVQSQAKEFTENPNFNSNKSILLEGGYDCGYVTIIGKTTLNGTLTISNGSVTIYNSLEIK